MSRSEALAHLGGPWELISLKFTVFNLETVHEGAFDCPPPRTHSGA